MRIGRNRRSTADFVLLSRRTVQVVAVAVALILTTQLVLIGVSFARINRDEPGAAGPTTAPVEIAFMFTLVVLLAAVIMVPFGYTRARRIYRKVEAIVRDPNLRYTEVRRLGSFGRVLDRIMDRQEYRFRLLRGYVEAQRDLIRNLVDRHSSPVMVADAQQLVFSVNDSMRKTIDEDRSSIRLDQLEMEPPYGELVRRIIDEGGSTRVTLKGKDFVANGSLGWFPEWEPYDSVWHGLQYVVVATGSLGGFGADARKRMRAAEGETTGRSRGWRRLFQGLGRRS